MTSIGLVANNYTIVNPTTSQQANINYMNELIMCDKDVSIGTQYTSLSSLPANTVAVSGLINNAISNLQTQINNVNIPSNITSINNPSTNVYTVTGNIGSQVTTLLKISYF
jgi:hypothetical protein